MGAFSHIGWTDHTFNPWYGCTKISPGCANCYAEARDHRFCGGIHWGPGAPRQRTGEANWRQVLRWEREASIGRFRQCPQCGWRGSVPTDEMDCPTAGCGLSGIDMDCARPRVFSASLADWLDEEAPIYWLADFLELIWKTPHLDWLLLTKRPGNWLTRMCRAFEHVGQDEAHFNARPGAYKLLEGWIGEQDAQRTPENIWIGATVEDQPRAIERVPLLLKIPAWVRFLSCEPLLGPLDIPAALELGLKSWWPLGRPALQWVICGGESGPNARPMHPDWARGLSNQCACAGVPFFFKQWGEWGLVDRGARSPIWMNEVGVQRLLGPQQYDPPLHLPGVCWSLLGRVGTHKSGRLLDGREYSEFPIAEREVAL